MVGRICRPPSAWWFLLPALSGWLVTLSAPPRDDAATAWVALVPLLLYLQRADTPVRAALGSGLAGVVFFFLYTAPFQSLRWEGWGAGRGWLGVAPHHFAVLWHAIMSLWCSAWWALWGALLVRLAPTSRGRVWLAPALWILLCEAGRAATFFHLTFGFLGYAAHPWRTLPQLAAVTGVMGLSALFVLVNAWLAHLTWRGLARRAGGWMRDGLIGASVALTLGVGWLAARGHATARNDAPPLVVAALQGGTSRAYADGLERAVAQGAALIVVPELPGGLTVVLDDVPFPHAIARPVTPSTLRRLFAHPLRHRAVTFIVAADTVENRRLYSSLIAWNASGVRSRYDKRVLTPFAERRPGLWQLLAPRGRFEFTPGAQRPPLTVEGVAVGGVICQEVLFAGPARARVHEGAQVLVASGDDGIFRDPAVAMYYYVAARFRAIETHRPLIRALRDGVSAIIGADGAVLARASLSQPAALVAAVKPSDVITPYVRLGDGVVVFPAVVLVVAAGGAVRGGRTGWRRRRRGRGRSGRADPRPPAPTAAGPS